MIARRDRCAQPPGGNQLADHVALGRDRGQAGPDIVQKPGAKGQARFHACLVERQPHVGFQQAGRPLPGRQPGHKEDVPIQEPQLSGQLPRLVQHGHAGAGGVEKDQSHVSVSAGDRLHGSHRREGIEPVPQAPAPHDDPIVRPDARHPALEYRPGRPRGLGRQPKGHDIDQVPQGHVALVSDGVDPALGEHGAQPQIALALAGAQNQVRRH